MNDEHPNFWSARVVEYRDEEAIAQAIASASKVKVDLSLIKELRTYFPHLKEGEKEVKSIRGPADLGRGLDAAEYMLYTKDRANYIILTYENYKGRLERLQSIVRSSLFSKREIQGLKNEAQRGSIVELTAPEIEDKLSKVKRVLGAAKLVVTNTNQSYNILKTQVEIIKEMMYEAGLTKAMRGKGSDKLAERL